jgi:HPt (histidine-containing phosphotransfer) domain-containing protein
MIASLEMRMLDLRNRFVGSLPARVADIAETLRKRQSSAEAEDTLDRQFHNLAGTAGTFGLFAIAEVASDGFDACADLNGALIEGEARYLWSIVEELENEAVRQDHGLNTAAFFTLVNGAVAA